MKQRLNVLIVDDEAELRRSLVTILTQTLPQVEVSVIEAETGLEALEKFAAHDFDLVLMDVRMPGMDGLEALAKIKEDDPRTFVVIMTAHSNLSDAVRAIRDGAYDYVEKPVDATKLSNIVRKAMEARELISDLALSNPIF